ADVIFIIGGKMEPADYRVDFCHPRHRLRLLDAIDDTAMAARGENDKSTSPKVEGGGEFVLELVGNNRFGLLLLRELARKAADPVPKTDLHGARREHLLEAV